MLRKMWLSAIFRWLHVAKNVIVRNIPTVTCCDKCNYLQQVQTDLPASSACTTAPLAHPEPPNVAAATGSHTPSEQASRTQPTPAASTERYIEITCIICTTYTNLQLPSANTERHSDTHALCIVQDEHDSTGYKRPFRVDPLTARFVFTMYECSTGLMRALEGDSLPTTVKDIRINSMQATAVHTSNHPRKTATCNGASGMTVWSISRARTRSSWKGTLVSKATALSTASASASEAAR